MTLPIQWNDIFNIPEDASSVRIERHGSGWKYILDQITCLPQLTHLEFGQEITSVEFIEALLKSNIMPNVEHLLLPDSVVSDSYWPQLHALQSLHIQCTRLSNFSFNQYTFNHFTALNSLQIDSMPNHATFNRISPHLSQLTALNVCRFEFNIDIDLGVIVEAQHILLEPIWKMTQLRELTWEAQSHSWGEMLNGLPHLETVCLNARLDYRSSIPWLGTSTLRSLTLCGDFNTQDVLLALTNMPQLTQLTLSGQMRFQPPKSRISGFKLKHKTIPSNQPQDGLKPLLKPISAMHSLASFTLEMTSDPDDNMLADWIQHLPPSLQSLRFANVFFKRELNWNGFYKFNQLISLDCDRIGRRLWTDFRALSPQLPTTLTSLTLKADWMYLEWFSDLPDLPHLTCLSVLENWTIAKCLPPSLPALVDAFTILYDKFPELMWLKRDSQSEVQEEWILLQQYRKRLPLTFWATHPLHPDKIALKAREQSLRRDAELHNVILS